MLVCANKLSESFFTLELNKEREAMSYIFLAHNQCWLGTPGRQAISNIVIDNPNLKHDCAYS